MALKLELLDNEAEIGRIDPAGMLRTALRLPEMLAEAERLTAYVALPAPQSFSQVLVLGMGGSAIAGDLAADLFLKQASAPLISLRNYTLPEYVSPETLVLALSYSGNTEETLTAVKEAARKGAKIVCATSGGKLKELAENSKFPFYLIPSNYQPRAALPYLFVPLLVALGKLKIVPPESGQLKEAIALLAKLKDEWGPAKPARVNPAKQLAKKLAGKIPVIFGAAGTTAGAALRWKCQLNENAKLTALVNVFPELNHNEIVNLGALKREQHNFALVILRDEDDNERVKKRIEITKSLLVRQLGGVSEVASQGKSALARLLSLVLFGDLLSVYLAVLKETDPTPVEAIARLKKELNR
ncbi:MAG: bifunctional phosphoglucose/phosphomannose isomerase [Candidatus Saganbacteria bacterium]|nr:bifunctional phosphoglucose/phosphomannose isomerase [Candidatus Saganbacteria bacterium]